MGVIAFGAPGIDSYHLHERLRRELLQNGHRAPVLCVDRVAHTFWRHQGGEVVMVREGPADPMRAPLARIAARECRRRGIAAHDSRYPRTEARCHERLARLLPGLLQWFEGERPDLLLLHEPRTAEHALLQFIARELGTRVLWTGAGLLPHTLQVDEQGLDGEASACQRPLADYRIVAGEPSLLDACLSNVLARTAPAALTRREIVVPPWRDRGSDAIVALLAGDGAAVREAFSAWRRAALSGPADDHPPDALPPPPFVTLLLQADDDERVRLDCDAPPGPRQLIEAAADAAARLGEATSLVVVVPPRGIDERLVRGLCTATRVYFAAAHAAPEAAATALATITINHPSASTALLAGTPVVHLGRALYGLPGVAVASTTAGLGGALRAAFGKDHAALRRRFLTWLFGHGHVWCSPRDPDHNGLAGLVQAIEARLQERSPGSLRLQYRAGPAWPLAAEGRGH